MTLQEFRILQVLSILTPRKTKMRERFVGEHAIAMQFDRRVNVPRALDDMLQRSLVEKGIDPVDHKSVCWRIAEKGQEVVNA
jgi:DNA-binding MarR family transcriptional regulator